MGSCCHHNQPRFEGLSSTYRRVLWLVIAINGSMFLAEMIAGHLAGSRALQADALDFFGDSLTYAITLAVIGRSLLVRSSAALFKGGSLLLLGLWVAGSTLWSIADQLRGAMDADDFRDYMLSFLFLRYLSDNYETAAKKELGKDYPDVGGDPLRLVHWGLTARRGALVVRLSGPVRLMACGAGLPLPMTVSVVWVSSKKPMASASDEFLVRLRYWLASGGTAMRNAWGSTT